MGIKLAPFPLRSGVADRLTQIMSRPWVAWVSDLVEKVDLDVTLVASASLTTQAASISATSFGRAVSTEGLYRVSYFARITRAATTSSSLTVAIGGVNGGVTCSMSGSAMTGNTTATVQSGTVNIQSDASESLTYTTTYASSGGTAMQYGLWLTLERVKS